MKSVMISIQPKWCELIASGKKTVEVRKTRPKLETPFKCYIYETKAPKLKYVWTKKDYEGYPWFEDMDENEKTFCKFPQGSGKVIGEFVCDYIVNCLDINMDSTCLTVPEWLKYTKGHKGNVWGWHISDLVIYDKPKELSEFYRRDNTYDNAFAWAFEDRNKQIPLSRPPQSWCYVDHPTEKGGEG